MIIKVFVQSKNKNIYCSAKDQNLSQVIKASQKQFHVAVNIFTFDINKSLQMFSTDCTLLKLYMYMIHTYISEEINILKVSRRQNSVGFSKTVSEPLIKRM